ncbi:MAG TPA: aldo/keto reductase [Pyrinomonadaceae bacterium]|jgi:aryl-alcohol dehydrogenase-like predicted oxidoreductase|nr:aldo/keto reductase [Pyrinomonadaceae bacterium]
MERSRLGKTELEVSRLGFGGVEIDRDPEVTQAVVDELLNSAIDAGLNLIDTAAAYGDSEELIGKAIAGRRKDVVLLSKCGALERFTRHDWSKQGILETIQTSLRNLQTDHLDVAQLHSCGLEILKQGEVIEALIIAKERGYTRFAGYSGDSFDAKYAVEMDFFDTLQTSVNIADQQAVELTIPAAKERDMGVIAKRPIANAVWLNKEKPENPYHHDYWERIQKLRYPFVKKSVEGSIAAALRFTLSVEGVTTAIVGTAKPGRWRENAKYVAEGKLAPEEFEVIRERWHEVADESWVGQV